MSEAVECSSTHLRMWVFKWGNLKLAGPAAGVCLSASANRPLPLCSLSHIVVDRYTAVTRVADVQSLADLLAAPY